MDLMRVIYFVIYDICIPIAVVLVIIELLKLLCNNLIQPLALFAFNAREHMSTDLEETEETFLNAILFGVSKIWVVDNTFVKPQGLFCLRFAQST